MTINIPFVVVYCCTYVPSGDDLLLSQRIFSGGGDALVKCWDIQTGDNVLSLQGHTQEVVCILRVFLPLTSFLCIALT